MRFIVLNFDKICGTSCRGVDGEIDLIQGFRGSNSGGSDIFCTFADPPWDPANLL